VTAVAALVSGAGASTLAPAVVDVSSAGAVLVEVSADRGACPLREIASLNVPPPFPTPETETCPSSIPRSGEAESQDNSGNLLGRFPSLALPGGIV
jgi:hypothetical protein